MFCIKCQKDLSQCECPDLQERLDKIASGGHFVYRQCKVCGKHYDLCKCKNPIWGTSETPKPQESIN